MTIDEQDQPGRSRGRDQGIDELVLAADRAGQVVRDQVAAIVDAAALQADQVQHRSEEVSRAAMAEAREAAQRVLQLIRSIEREVEDLQRSASRESDILRGMLDMAALSASARELRPGAPQTATDTSASSRALVTGADTLKISTSELEPTDTDIAHAAWDTSASATGSANAEDESDGDTTEPQESAAAEKSRPRRSYWWRS